MAFKKVDARQSFPKMEEEILKFWEEKGVFQKSLENRADCPLYTFYDGPPFATGTPHYGHLVGSAMKDIVPRFWTMKGKYVPRKWGWDCHGLPIENIVEKELGSKAKKDIEKMGVDKFNELCRSKVLGYVNEWKKTIKRFGRWADMENAYKTMDLEYMESVWWVFKELYDKGLVYESYRSMHICPRCETTLSQSEVAEGYRDVKDLSVIAEFVLSDEERTSVLAWTTTPWTLIGNVALAVGNDIDYVKIEKKDEGIGELVRFILAKNRLEKIFSEDNYKIISEFKGEELIGKAYKPLFDYYYKDEKLENRENGWKIYAGDFVTTEDGTGVVHIAPAFGEEDMNMGKKYSLPFVQHVGMDGMIKEEAGEFGGLHVKPSGDTQKTDVEIIKYLAKNNLLFSKEKYEHSYPHCWRCETPLLNYATSSWFVSVEKIKDNLLENAKEINWSPKHIKKGSFGNWLSGARDWSISRQRFWASVMPIWKCNCGELKVVGSVEELRDGFENPNKLFLLRHGEAENNVRKILNSFPEKEKYSLTQRGKEQVEKTASELVGKKIDVIISSPLQRTKETAEIISKILNVEIIFDERLRETDTGRFDGKSVENWEDIQRLQLEINNNSGVESLYEMKERISSFIDDINKKYSSKNIVVVSHGDPLRMIDGFFSGFSIEEISKKDYPKKGEVKRIYSKSVDLHKHIVDKITLKCEKCAGVMKRIPDVLDTWFDSGSMPYAEIHYPFENQEKFEKGFPAEFIAEGVDQTRCWFYYLHVIAGGVMSNLGYKNVVVNGIVLAEDGKKMAKRLKNYPDPNYILDRYGADALRFYLTTSPVMQAENLNFKEADLADFVRGMFRMLWNTYSFFVLYANIDEYDKKRNIKHETKNNLLDSWIISELNMLIRDVNANMESYELTRAARCFPKFVDNLSNWYIRRSRKRFWKSEDDGDKNEAYETLHYVLITLAKLMAPFTPFMAEEIFKNLTGEESVHLADFPVANEKLIDEKLNRNMQDLREIITLGLQDRAKNKIKVRQPLKEVLLNQEKYSQVFNELINKTEWSSILFDELNVKGASLSDKTENVMIDTEITPGLKLEGKAREIIRFIQEMRKEVGYEVDNRIEIVYGGESLVLEKFNTLIAKETLANGILSSDEVSGDLKKTFEMDGEKLEVGIKKT